MKSRRIILWLAAGLSALMAIVLIALAVLPYFINTGALKGSIEAGFSGKLGGQFSYAKADLFFFPRPGIIIHNGKIEFPEGMRGSFESLTVHPKFLPLLTGRLAVSFVRLTAPKVSLPLEHRTAGVKIPSIEEIRAKLRRLFKASSEKIPNLDIEVKNGSLTLLDEDHAVFSFSGLDADIALPPKGPKIRLTGSSNFAKEMAILLQLDPESLSGKAIIDLRQVRIQPVSSYFMSDGPFRVDGAGTDLALRFRTAGMKTLDGEVSSALSFLTVKRKKKQLEIRGATLRMGVAISDNRSEVSLEELKLSAPRLTLAGKLLIDHKARKVGMNIEGSGIDLRSTRKAAYSIAGDVPIVQDIFSYVLDGTVPHVTISSQAGTFEDLGNTENIRIGARIEKGGVFIRGPRLDCKNVYADCVISNGMLDATGISAEVGKIRIRNGKVRVGLKGAVVPLKVDVGVEADIGSSRGLLMRLIKNESVVRELSLFSNVRGNAAGRVILEGKSDSPHVVADMRKVTFSADYARLPYPVKITGGGISYDGKTVATRKLRGSVGSSSFAGLTASLELQKSYILDFDSGSLDISLPELHHWLGSFEALKPVLKRIGSVAGEVYLSSLKARGPLFRPEEWHFRAAGSGRDIAITLSDINASVTAAGTDFIATEEKITVSGKGVRMLDSDINLSGELDGYMKKVGKIDLSLKGSIGPKSFSRVSDMLGFPSWIHRSLQLSVSSSHLIRESDGSISFSGVMTVAKGPEVSFDMVDDKTGLTLKKVVIDDSSSHAEISLNLNKHRIGLVFSGRLTGKTAGAFLASVERPGGAMSGNIRADILLDKPLRFTAEGKMTADGIVIPWKGTAPVEINRLSVEAAGKHFRVDTCDLKWGDDSVSLRGDLMSSARGVVVNMDASSGVIDAASIEKKIGEMEKEEAKQDESATSSSWLIGTVRLKTGKLRYGRISIAPLSAEIFLDGHGLSASVTKAVFCGISLPGRVNVTGGQISLDFWPGAENASVVSAISCFSHSFDLDDYATGTFDLSGKITGKGAGEEIIQSVTGNIDLTARSGRIYYVPSILKVLAFLDITELAKGYSDVWKKGLAYDKVTVKSRLKDGRIEIDEGILDSPYMKMASQGYVDPAGSKLDVKVLVSPMRTIDRIIEKLPVIGYILGGTLFSIPVRLSGNLEDPRVSPILISSDSGLLGMMKRTLELPFKVLAPSVLKKKKPAE